MLSLQYSFDTVIYALSSIYKTYILKEHEIKTSVVLSALRLWLN